MSDVEDIVAKWDRLAKNKRRRDAVRRVPILHASAPPGTCKWCGKAVLYPEKHKRAGAVNERKGWHDDCLGDFFLHSRPDVQREFLNKRDGEKCAKCGAAPLRVLRGGEVTVWDTKRPPGQMPVRYCEIRIVIWLHVEHTIPLWKVRHLPDAERVKFFGPDNITLMCDGPKCHKAKTRIEAGERAHLDAVEMKWQTHKATMKSKRPSSTTSRSGKAPSPSRWPKGRKLRSGKTLRSRPLRSSRRT